VAELKRSAKKAMHSLIAFFLVAAVIMAGCTARQSLYKRFELPQGLDEATEQKVFAGIVQAMRSQHFINELKKRFPAIRQSQLLKTDIRWDVVKTTTPSRSFLISFGVKDTTDFPDAEALVAFCLEYGEAEAQKLLPASR
jgi:hypothetical protein